MNNQKVISLFGDTIVKFQIWTNQLGLCQFNRYVFNFSDNFLKDVYYMDFFSSLQYFFSLSGEQEIKRHWNKKFTSKPLKKLSALLCKNSNS